MGTDHDAALAALGEECAAEVERAARSPHLAALNLALQALERHGAGPGGGGRGFDGGFYNTDDLPPEPKPDNPRDDGAPRFNEGVH